MSSYQSPTDLEKQAQGPPPSISHSLSLDMYVQMCRQTSLLENILVETKRIKNKLWNIEDVLTASSTVPEYRTEEKQ